MWSGGTSSRQWTHPRTRPPMPWRTPSQLSVLSHLTLIISASAVFCNTLWTACLRVLDQSGYRFSRKKDVRWARTCSYELVPDSWMQNQIQALHSCRKSQHQWVIALMLRLMCVDMSAAARLPQQWRRLCGMEAAVMLLLWHLELVKLFLHSLYPKGADKGRRGAYSWKHVNRCIKHTEAAVNCF